MNGVQARKLIEVALTIREISTESVRDKSLLHGHISTLHLWWARRHVLGEGQSPPLIDALHRSMLLWRGEQRHELMTYLAERDLLEDGLSGS